MTERRPVSTVDEPVLVVDDDAGVRETVVEILASHGIRAEGAGSARQGVEVARRLRPAVAVVDNRLPDAGGVELGARLKAVDPDIQVLLVTAFATLETAIAAVGHLDDFLTKPVPPEQLVRAVRAALDRWRLRRENAELVARLRQTNTRLQESVADRTRDLAGIITLAESLSRAVEVDEVAAAAAGALVEATGAASGAVYLRDELAASLELRASVGGAAFPERLSSRRTSESTGGLPDGSVRAELVVAGQPVGVVVLSRPQQANPQLLATLATLSALAVQNAQRFARERETVERISELDRMKDTLLASVSHELRTPLAAIVGFAEVLERHGTSMAADQRDEILRRMVTQGARLSRLIENILTSTVIEGDIMQVPSGWVTLPPVVERVLASVPDAVPITRRIPEQVPAVVGEPGRLEQVIGNLVDNAVKYGGGGPISVSVTPAEPGVVEVRVSDQGPGVDEGFVEKLFEPFTQGPASQRLHGGGVGLGLYIARRLVEAMGGTIGVESKPGAGTTFWVRLRSAGGG
ncbi:MAG TPA: ATP-binding protein [Acidimicrobiales bacterium]|nr:ATP-binding protein [Acidimicrobiales bacterium]